MSPRNALHMLSIRSWYRPMSLPRGMTAASVSAAAVLAAIAALAFFAPLIAPHDPTFVAPAVRLQSADQTYLLGTDSFGRDLLSRLIYGGQVSLLIGLGTAVLATAAGMLLGLTAGYFRAADSLIMRAMDAMMAIPSILLAIAIVSLWGASLQSVLFAVAISETPRVARLARSLTLTARSELYVEAAQTLGTSPFQILWRHVIPNALGPLIVLGTYICASAIILESILSFLGTGIDPQIPTWGNIIAEGRMYIEIKPSLVLWPSLFLTVTVWALHILGDTTRDRLDPKALTRKMADQ